MSRHPFLYSILIVGVVCLVVFVGAAGLLSLTDIGARGWIPGGAVAVVKIEGPIFESETVLKRLHELSENDSVKAVVLRLDSPGGAVAPSQEIFEEVKKLKQKKKVVVSMGATAASGAYYIAAGADKIIASPGTITGSIGVIMRSFGMEEVIDWVRVKNRVIKSGQYKDVGSPFREMTVEERAYLQQLLDNMYGQFTKAVIEGRQLNAEKITDIAEGRIFTGEQALAIGLIDGLGTLYDAIAEAKKMAGLNEDARVIWPSKRRSLISNLVDESVLSAIKGWLVPQHRGLTMPHFFYMM